MSEKITLGNFFSGSGTWELAAKMCGATPIWESEIEPFPVELESKRFPECKQLGDITKISGYDIEPCDIMTNSSPCQDISVAGKRKGMEQGSDTRSSLFHEVIRITKEMRENDIRQLQLRRTDDNIRLPRPYIWMWENVCGALSSNQGEDFRKVLEEIARIITPEVSIPMPRGGKWSNAGSVDGSGWNISWCVRNAAREGVPQRRRRLFLVASFAGNISSREILFKCPSLPWNFAEIRNTWEETTRSLEERIDEAREYIRTGVSKATDGNGVVEKNS